MARTRRADLEDLVARVSRATGLDLRLDRHQPGDSRTPYRVEDARGRLPFGERRRSAGELADALRFSLAVAWEVEKRKDGRR